MYNKNSNKSNLELQRILLYEFWVLYQNNKRIKKIHTKDSRKSRSISADNASDHTIDDTTKYLKSIRFKKLDWQAWSLDLNPIENLWGWIKNELSKKDITTEEDSNERVQNLWDSISEEYIENLIKSIKGRILECIEKNGDKINY